ncbi:hypothetical protein CBR_g17021 [Chara braunii]|uniref:Uncharacterized protein n=1 Tax=Chara braunii TaxID=69332 RepID=A0A388KUF9_CHABU|nr:hypothetical protein CBR_g17021 [Chara braunii]|eukprot:GBG73679.1 hypothetical protein CBR_g17021 [Chara braunii]
MIPTIERLRRVTRGEQKSLVAFTRRFKRLSQALVDRRMLSEVDRCVVFMLHLPEEKRKEVLEKVPRDSANFEIVAEVVFTGEGVDVREYMTDSLDMALRSMRTQRSDGPRGYERQPPGRPGQRWGGGPPGWRSEPGNQGNKKSDREAGGNRASEWGNSRWRDAKDGRWGDPPQPRNEGTRPEVNVDNLSLQETRLGKKSEVGETSNSSRVQMTESPGSMSIREPQVSRIKFVETQPEEEGPCLRVRTQVGARPSKGKESATEGGRRRSGDNDQPMVDAKVMEERKGEEPTSPKSPRKKGAKKFEMKCTLDEIDTVTPLRRTLMQPMQCTLLEYLAASKSVREKLISITKKVRIPLAGGPTVPGDGPAREEVQSSRITMEKLPTSFFSEEELETKKFYKLGSGQLQAVVSGKKMRALVDNGSESTVCRDSIAKELGLEVDRGVFMPMVVADNKLQPAEGVCHNPLIEVAGVEATVPIFLVKECSSELILGRT